MSKIKKKNFIFVSLLLAIVCGLAYCLPTFINSKQISQTTGEMRWNYDEFNFVQKGVVGEGTDNTVRILCYDYSPPYELEQVLIADNLFVCEVHEERL